MTSLLRIALKCMTKLNQNAIKFSVINDLKRKFSSDEADEKEDRREKQRKAENEAKARTDKEDCFLPHSAFIVQFLRGN